MARKQIKKVFISHSHKDRDEALRLKEFLERNKANTFLDQEILRPSDNLPDNILKGIAACDKFLLIWSRSAAKSDWVRKEWEFAYETKKRIIPYRIDSKPLPDALENFIYIDKEDQEHGNAELLRAVLGKIPKVVTGVDIFPGHWEAELVPPDGSGQAHYDLDLRSNGQVAGEIRMKPAGQIGWAAGQAAQYGIDLGFMFQPTPVRGNWSYRNGSGLRLDLIQSAHGREFPFTVQIYTSGKKENVLYGTGPAGTKVVFKRKSS